MSRTRWIKGVGVVVLVGLALWAGSRLLAPAEETDEEKIERVLIEVTAAFEEADVDGIVEHFDESYTDSLGNRRERVRFFLVGQFRGGKRYAVGIDELSIEVGEGEATATFLAHGREGKKGDLVKMTRMGSWRVEARFVPVDGSWRIARLDLERERD